MKYDYASHLELATSAIKLVHYHASLNNTDAAVKAAQDCMSELARAIVALREWQEHRKTLEG